jgi:hypothetical protein
MNSRRISPQKTSSSSYIEGGTWEQQYCKLGVVAVETVIKDMFPRIDGTTDHRKSVFIYFILFYDYITSYAYCSYAHLAHSSWISRNWLLLCSQSAIVWSLEGQGGERVRLERRIDSEGPLDGMKRGRWLDISSMWPTVVAVLNNVHPKVSTLCL